MALGLVSAFNQRLKEASKTGDAPAWLVQRAAASQAEGFYPNGMAFHSSVTPTPAPPIALRGRTSVLATAPLPAGCESQNLAIPV